MEQGETIWTKEAAAIIGRSVRALEYWRQWNVDPPFVKKFGRCMYSRAEVHRFTDNMKESRSVKGRNACAERSGVFKA